MLSYTQSLRPNKSFNLRFRLAVKHVHRGNVWMVPKCLIEFPGFSSCSTDNLFAKALFSVSFCSYNKISQIEISLLYGENLGMLILNVLDTEPLL